MIKRCDHCRTLFDAKFPSAKLCLDCWKKRERAFAEYDDLRAELARLDTEVRRLRHALHHQQGIPPEMLKRLIGLCHPDRHGNSEPSTEVTKWLLAQRPRLATQ